MAGALIGPLFVAISVAHERLTADDAAQAHRIRAAAALTAFINALTISLFALVPGVHLGWPTLSVSVVGFLFIVASLLSLLRVRQSQPGELRDAAFLVGLAITFGFQFLYAVRLLVHPGNASDSEIIAVLVIVCFLIGISRSCEAGVSIVGQFRSPSAAHDALGFEQAQVKRASKSPGAYMPFLVSGIPGAVGFALTHAHQPGGAVYIAFADGPYYYLNGEQENGKLNAASLASAAQRLYRRVSQ